MSANQTKPRYTLTLEAQVGPQWQTPPDRRLARLLKTLWRGYGFWCVDAKEVASPPAMEIHEKEGECHVKSSGPPLNP